MTVSMPDHTTRLTPAAFELWILRPENADRRWELIDGKAVEIMPSNPYSSWIVQKILARIMQYLIDHPIGRVTGEGAGYLLGSDILSPDGAFTTQPLVETGFQPTPPQLAIEVVSPTDRSADIKRKMLKYVDAGVIVWVIYPREKVVDVWEPGAPLRTMRIDDVLTAPDVLPGFSIAVREIVEE
jgi:Uma2 family endonuclease